MYLLWIKTLYLTFAIIYIYKHSIMTTSIYKRSSCNACSTIFSLMQNEINKLAQLNRQRTRETYTAALNSFKAFRNGTDIHLSDVNSELIMAYESYLLHRGVVKNTISFYMRILRAAYNRAANNGLTPQQSPFNKVYTGVDKTIKRAISAKYIRKIKNINLSDRLDLDFARDMFMFSFYTRGMSFIDMAYLRKKNLKNSTLTYCRQKTKQNLYIHWEKCMNDIVEKYDKNETPYLLPIICDMGKNDRKQYLAAMAKINRNLKTIAQMVNLSVNLSLYVARHSWASIAHSRNIPISVISESLGHDSEQTTQIYLASLNNSLVDKANAKIINNL